jgi:hypothetical protein
MLAESGLIITNLRAKSSQYVIAICSGVGLAIFRIVDVNQQPLASLFTVGLRFDPVGRYGGSVFAHCRPKEPVELDTS